MLERWLGSTGGRGLAVKKVAADQLAFAPPFLASLLALIDLSRNGRDVDKTAAYVKKTFPDVLVTGYVVWIPVQYVNFSKVPLDYRLLFVQVLSFAVLCDAIIVNPYSVSFPLVFNLRTVLNWCDTCWLFWKLAGGLIRVYTSLSVPGFVEFCFSHPSYHAFY